MSYLSEIVQRHRRDWWRDVGFVAAAVLLTALAIGATTSKGAGTPSRHDWSITLVDPDTHARIP